MCAPFCNSTMDGARLLPPFENTRTLLYKRVRVFYPPFLFLESHFLDERLVCLLIILFEVLEVSATIRNHLKKTPA